MARPGRADTFLLLSRGIDLRIAIVIERFVPDGGGVENVAWQVAHGLARAGEQVTIVCREAHLATPAPSGFVPRRTPAEPTGSEARPSGERERDAPHRAARHVEGTLTLHPLRTPRVWQPIRVLGFSRGASRAIRTRPGFDVVHSFSRTLHQDLYRAGGGSHADYLDRNHDGLGRRVRGFSPRHRVLLEIERRVFADPSQRIQCASRLVADSLIARHGVASERIWLQPNGVDLARYASPAARAAGRALREELNTEVPEEQSAGPGGLWLFPASGWRRKGLETLLRALGRTRQPSTRVWVVGRDSASAWQGRAVTLGVADRVRFLGPRSDLEVLYHAVDGMVLPTRYDPFANVTLEAAAAGLPIITTRANGAAEWLRDAVRTIAEPADADALAAALDALADPTARAELGTRAARQAAAFDWAFHIDALRQEYARIAASRPHRGTD
jgi:UDP-glucose:(heptosyl)LPS alpha-1,3-glucosyltransferase